MILKADIDFSMFEDDEIVDFLTKMLTRDAAERFTITELVEH